MSKIALQYGATIDKYVGDAIVMFFGDPATRGVREDACRRSAPALAVCWATVFETIVDKTTRICEATFACLGLFEGQALRFAAISGAPRTCCSPSESDGMRL